MSTLHYAPTRNGSTSGWPSNTKATLLWTGTHGPKETIHAITQVNVLENGTPSKAATLRSPVGPFTKWQLMVAMNRQGHTTMAEENSTGIAQSSMTTTIKSSIKTG